MGTTRSKASSKPMKGSKHGREAAAALQRVVEKLEQVVDAPLGPELPINPDAPLGALDTDELEILNDTQTLVDTESLTADSDLVDKKRAAVLSGGDVDAAWDQADAGEETVGGSNPTPDQNVVDDLGRAAGITYSDTEPLRPDEKVAVRDEKRWEVDPASAEDYEERQQELFGPRGKKRP
jgi:hypothetical protein